MIRFKYLLFSILIGVILIPMNTYAQKEELTEEEKKHKLELEEEAKYLQFQSLFFEAINQKARQDYTKAIESLEICKSLYPEDAGLNFEFAKNYLELKEYDNAIFFANKVLAKKNKDLAVLEFLKSTYSLQLDYPNAITIQNKLVVLKPDRENDLVYLFIRSKQKGKARESYTRLEKLGLLDYRKAYYKKILFPKQPKSNVVDKVKKEPKEKSSYSKIKENLTILWEAKDHLKLDKKSKEALQKYPAQPFIYLMQGRALIGQAKYKKAIQNLEFGLDFVLLDNKLVLEEFYTELQLAFTQVGNTSKALKYQQKIEALKK